MRLALLVWLALLTTPLNAQMHMAMDTAVGRQLVELWRRQPGDSLACVTAHVEQDSVLVMDAVTLAWRCDRPGIAGQFGFLPNDTDADKDDVLAGMAAVLESRPDLWFSGEIYGATPVPAYGQLLWMPRGWWAVRSVAPPPTRRAGV